MTKENRDNILLEPMDMLVKDIPDYYKKADTSKLNMSTAAVEKNAVGSIQHVGEGLSKDLIGCLVYFHKNMADPVNVKGIGIFLLLTPNLKFLIRKDQSINNY
jgi:hypothetical protein